MSKVKVKLDGNVAFVRSLHTFRSPSVLRTYYGCSTEAGDRIWQAGFPAAPLPKECFTTTINIGGRGSSKTVCAIGTVLQFALSHPGCEILIVRRHWNELHTSIIADLRRVARIFVGAKGPDDASKDDLLTLLMTGPSRREGYYEVIIHPTGGEPSRITIKPEPEKASDREIEDSFKGPQYGMVFLDELTQLKPITLSTLQDNLRSPVVEHPRIICCTNPPPSPKHWVARLAKESLEMELRGEKPQVNVVRSDMRDNPFLPPGYIKRMMAKYANDPIKYAMYIEGKDGLSVDGVPVFKNAYNLDRNVAELKYSPLSTLYVGLDFGWNGWAAVFGQVVDRGYFNVIGEILEKDITFDSFIKTVKDYIQRRFPKIETVQYFGDPNSAVQTNAVLGATTSALLRRRHGIRMKWRKRSVEHGLDTLKQLMVDHGIDGSRPRFQIDHRWCPELHNGLFGGYVYKDVGGVVKPDPYKDGHFDHVVDALRYLSDNLFGNYNKPEKKKKGPSIAPGMKGRRDRY